MRAASEANRPRQVPQLDTKSRNSPADPSRHRDESHHHQTPPVGGCESGGAGDKGLLRNPNRTGEFAPHFLVALVRKSLTRNDLFNFRQQLN